MTIDFLSEIKLLQERAADRGVDVEALVNAFVADALATDSEPPRKPLSHAEFMTKLQAIAELGQGTMGFVDDGRDSIYAGCGE